MVMLGDEDMDVQMIMVGVVGALHFYARAACGQSWHGMRHSDDVRIVVDRAMDHAKTCPKCAEKGSEASVSRENVSGSIEPR
jgi:hypothetical protein